MISIILLSVSLSNAVASSQSPCGNVRTEWSACESTQECTVAFNMCGLRAAYNSKFLKVIENYNRCMGPMISCASSLEDPNKNVKKSECKHKICELVKE